MSAGSASTKAQVSHVEQGAMAADVPSSSNALSGEQIRDQMAAHVHASKLRFTSWSSIQLYIIFFIAYCSKLFFSAGLSTMKDANFTKIPGELDSIALS
jgi:hypothetical protein